MSATVIIDSDDEEAAKSDLDAETELCKIDQEISDITKKIRNFEQRRRVLKLKAEKLQRIELTGNKRPTPQPTNKFIY